MEAREQVVRDHQETHREVDRLRTEAEELGECTRIVVLLS